MLVFALTVTIIVVRKVQFPAILCIYEICDSSYVAISYCLYVVSYFTLRMQLCTQQQFFKAGTCLTI